MNATDVDNIRLQINTRLDPKNKSKFGQFMTPSVIANFMANLFDDNASKVKLLDCGGR